MRPGPITCLGRCTPRAVQKASRRCGESAPILKTIVAPGAWVISSYQPGQRAVLKKNTYYGEWVKDSAGKGLPYLDTYSIRIVKDQNADLAAYLSGPVRCLRSAWSR